MVGGTLAQLLRFRACVAVKHAYVYFGPLKAEFHYAIQLASRLLAGPIPARELFRELSLIHI